MSTLRKPLRLSSSTASSTSEYVGKMPNTAVFFPAIVALLFGGNPFGFLGYSFRFPKVTLSPIPQKPYSQGNDRGARRLQNGLYPLYRLDSIPSAALYP